MRNFGCRVPPGECRRVITEKLVEMKDGPLETDTAERLRVGEGGGERTAGSFESTGLSTRSWSERAYDQVTLGVSPGYERGDWTLSPRRICCPVVAAVSREPTASPICLRIKAGDDSGTS